MACCFAVAIGVGLHQCDTLHSMLLLLVLWISQRALVSGAFGVILRMDMRCGFCTNDLSAVLALRCIMPRMT